MKEKLSLREIANWQLEAEYSEVDLPTIQRGFVWKPKQIEDLWDSILRGYPIGSFLLQRIGNKFDLLDGQQRATSIMLGFLNPYSSEANMKRWSDRTDRLSPTIWVDIDDQAFFPENSKYSIRVTTTSHPWGYQAIENSKALSIPDKRAALAIFEKNKFNKDKTYTQFHNTNIFPYDSSLPVPLAILIEAKSIEEVLEKLKSVPFGITTKQKKDEFKNRDEYLMLLSTTYRSRLEKTFSVVNSKIYGENALRVNYDIITKEVVNEKSSESNSQQDPTLFVRINSSGTKLDGDDLVYSIYKSLYPNSKQLIESIGASFAPAKLIISLVSRLTYTRINGFGFPSRLNVKRFQQQIANDNFKVELENLVGNEENSPFKTLFVQALEILRQRHNLGNRVPDFLVKQLIIKEPDLFLFLLTWLGNNQVKFLSESDKNKIVGKIFTLDWFGFDNYPELWKNVSNAEFFNQSLEKLSTLSIKKGIKAMVPPDLLREYFKETFDDALKMKDEWKHIFKPTQQIIEYYHNHYSSLDNLQIEEYFHEFVIWIRETRNKSLVSFAQREYLNNTFRDYNSMENLEDSAVPWDWDHIYPASWVNNKRVKTFSIRYWTWCIGNYRALSLEQNRAENNNYSPEQRLKEKQIRKNSFVCESNNQFMNDYQYWQCLIKREDDKESSARNHLHAILTRMINIYQKYWDDLEIENFFIHEE
ncbi:DUF262 domain-containing protein [Lactococcus formosensis]|uniref:DUF262 domain-containing protein n=1 Tax=Lactococcus formosensis TaxID=1281486 RepID=UPI003263E9F0